MTKAKELSDSPKKSHDSNTFKTDKYVFVIGTRRVKRITVSIE
ncbi:MAG: hypothetical protein RIC57_05090 [Balneola sp.]